jgi:hypothetical protein
LDVCRKKKKPELAAILKEFGAQASGRTRKSEEDDDVLWAGLK